MIYELLYINLPVESTTPTPPPPPPPQKAFLDNLGQFLKFIVLPEEVIMGVCLIFQLLQEKSARQKQIVMWAFLKKIQ